MQTEVVKLTPDLATQFMKMNTNNRPIRDVTVKNYAQIIKRGEWILNGEPIIFSNEGRMLNGQHRCSAVILSGHPIETLVVRDVTDPKAFATHDGGQKRTVGDILACNGEKYTNVLAAAAKAYAIIKAGKQIRDFTPTMALQVVEDCPALRYWASQFATRKGVRKIFTSAIVGVVCAGAELYGHDPLIALLDKLDTGIGLTEGDPALLLREKFFERKAGHYFSQDYALALYIKTVAAHCQHRKLRVLRMTSVEPAIPPLK